MEQRWLPATTTNSLMQRHTAQVLAWVEEAGGVARFAYGEFFYGQIRNSFTRKAYLGAMREFSTWWVERGISLTQVAPANVGRHLNALAVRAPTPQDAPGRAAMVLDELALRHLVHGVGRTVSNHRGQEFRVPAQIRR